jgi:hypothetical protein
MGFSAKQVQALRRNLDHRFIRTREARGRELYYIEGWYAITEANRIFGFDGWSRETLESRCVLARENRGTFLAVYIARVRITVHANGAAIIREATVPVKDEERPREKLTILRLKLQKPMVLNAPLQHSGNPSD